MLFTLSMDTEARKAAALERIGRQRAILVKAKDAGPACRECRFRAWTAGPYDQAKRAPTSVLTCTHHAAAGLTFSPETGDIREGAGVPVTIARAEGGICGPEALLFLPRSFGERSRDAATFAASFGLFAVPLGAVFYWLAF